LKHALIIEDNFLIALMLQEHLEANGYDTLDIAATQAQAIALAERRCPDLITADDNLEHGSGVEAIRHICRDNAIPVIFIVADPTNVKSSLPNALLLLKPFSQAALASAIKVAEKSPSTFA
jgi:two-component system, response regulator PdtaR